jgi:hypothetical protein
VYRLTGFFVVRTSFNPQLNTTEAMISWAVVGYLDEASFEYHVSSNLTIPLDFFNYTDRRINPVHDAEVIFQYATSEKIKINDANWWYQYQFVFYCFYGNAHVKKVGELILDDSKLLTVKQDLNQYLRQGVELVNMFEFRESSFGILGLSVEDPRYSTTPFEDGPPTPAPTSIPTYAPNGIKFDSSETNLPSAAVEKKNASVGDNFALPLDSFTHTTYTSPIDTQNWVSFI